MNDFPQKSDVNDEIPPTPRNCLMVAGLLVGFFLLLPFCLYFMLIMAMYGFVG